jgi:hypothetical protein
MGVLIVREMPARVPASLLKELIDHAAHVHDEQLCILIQDESILNEFDALEHAIKESQRNT